MDVAEDVSGIKKYNPNNDKKSVPETPLVKTKAPTVLGAVDSNCECKLPVLSEPCGNPDDTSTPDSECECETDCERPNNNNTRRDSKDKKIQFSLNETPIENPGKLQSPIDIKLNDAIAINYPALQFPSNYNEIPDRIYITDTYEVMFEYKTHEPPHLCGGPLKSQYKFVKLQFHWATDDSKGSEHTIDGKTFKMELHAIYIPEELDITTAPTHTKGYTIVAYFFELGTTDHPIIAALLDNFDQLDKIRDETKELDLVQPFAVGDLINTFSESYITYEGSLTVEPYSENVTWILSPYCIAISDAQMARFRSLKGVSVVNNNREVQECNKRVVNIAKRDDNIFRQINK